MMLFSCSGGCLLFAKGNWQEEDGLFDLKWNSQLYCTYPIVTSVLLFVVSLFQIYR